MKKKVEVFYEKVKELHGNIYEKIKNYIEKQVKIQDYHGPFYI